MGEILKQRFWQEKLLNVHGLLLLAVLVCALSYLIVKLGLVFGLVFIAAMVAVPILYLLTTQPRFGIMILIIAGFFLFFFLRLGIEFPLGTVMDALMWFLLIGFLFNQRLKPKKGIFKEGVAIFVLLWFVYAILQVANPWAASRMAWLYTVRTVGVVTMLYFVFVYYVDSVAFIRTLIKLWLALAVVAAIYALKQEFFGFSPSEMAKLSSDPLLISLLFIDGHWRKYSIFSDPVVFSYNMVMAFFLCLGMVGKGWKTWLPYSLIALLCVYSMLFSGTRGAYVLIPAGLVLFFILKFNKQILVFGLFAAVVLAVMIKIPTSNPTLYRFQTAFKPSDDASFNVRVENQRRLQPYILSHPFGGGLGGTGVWGVRFAPGSYLASFPPDSGYVRIAAEQGWVGLFLFGLMLFWGIKTGIENYFRIKNKELKSYCMAMTLILFVLGIGSYPQEALVQYPSNILFYLAMALIDSTRRIDEKISSL